MWFRRKRTETDFSEEIRAHIQMEIDRLRAEGFDADEAKARARREFGNISTTEERFHESSPGFSTVESIAQDVRYAARMLLKSPAFAAVAVLSLALGIGANAAIFQLVDAVRFRLLPVRDPQELVQVPLTDTSQLRGRQPRGNALTYPIWERIQVRQQALLGMFAFGDTAFNLSSTGESRMVRGLLVSGGFFDSLGLRPVAGRLLDAADDRRGCGLSGAVISYAFWQGHFGGQLSAIGAKLHLDSQPVEVIGVTPPNFFGMEVGQNFDVALPLCSAAAFDDHKALDDGRLWWLIAMGRLRPGWTLERAAAHFQSLSPALFESSLPPDYPTRSIKDYLKLKLTAIPAGAGISMLREQYSRSLWILLSIAGLVLLIACANLANLMLARATAREREIGVRLAIGASRGRLVRQLMTESLLISAVGAGLALLVAQMLSRMLVAMLSTDGMSPFLDLRQDWRVLGFAATLAITTSVLFGLMPARRATRFGPGEVLKTGTRGTNANRESFGLRRILVIAQVALSMVLLVGSFLFVRTLNNLLSVDAGFRQDGVLVADADFQALNLSPARTVEFRQRLVNELGAIPGVDGVTDTDTVPLGGGSTSNSMWLDGSDLEHARNSLRTQVGASYFTTLGTPVLAGRMFNAHDTAQSERVAIVNEAFALRLANGRNPVGRLLWIEPTPTEQLTSFRIVGLVRNTKYQELREDFLPIVFLPLSQDPNPQPYDEVLIHSNLPMQSLITSVKQKLTEADPGLHFSLRVLRTQIRESLLPERLVATLSIAFGILAGSLAAIGLYGVMSYMMARRKSEIGIRIALGASRGEIHAMVFRESGKLLAAGLIVGSLLSLAGTTVIRSLLFGVKPYDLMALAMCGTLLTMVALMASYIPARRAARLDPVTALREE